MWFLMYQKEQEIKKETTPKKKYYKPKIKREILEIDVPKIGNNCERSEYGS